MTPFRAMILAACDEANDRTVARRIGVHVGTVRRWRSGATEPDPGDRYRAALILLGCEGEAVVGVASSLVSLVRHVEGVAAELASRDTVDGPWAAAVLRGEIES